MPAEFVYCPYCGKTLEWGFIEGKDRKYCPGCDFIHYRNPLPVAIAVPVRNGRVLLIKRGIAPHKGMWSSPSGFIEEGETPEEACLRELKEEAGVTGRIVKQADVRRVEDTEVYGDMLVVRYIVAVDDDTPVAGDEADDARFFAIDELPPHYVKRFGDIIREIQESLL